MMTVDEALGQFEQGEIEFDRLEAALMEASFEAPPGTGPRAGEANTTEVFERGFDRLSDPMTTPNSWDSVTRAHFRGVLTRDQYLALSAARDERSD